jgi:CO/xanthine dehydrogenase Mo-binding subunit
MTGNAAVQAAERARAILFDAVSVKWKIPKSQLIAGGRKIFDVEDPAREITFAAAVQLAEAMFGTIGTVGSYKPPASAARYKGGGVGPSPAYSFTACVAEVNVDVETGIVTVPCIWIAHDLGQAINPLLAIGQAEGSVYMGLGEALMEEQVFRRNVHQIPSMLDYKSPTTMDMCNVVTYLVESPDSNGPFGAKELGQGPLLPVMPAICNAVYDAVGVRIDEIPITPEKVLKALRAKNAGKPARFGPGEFPPLDFGEVRIVPPPWEGGDGTAVKQPPAVFRMRDD